MKNIANYLDEFIEDDLVECACKKLKRNMNNDNMKSKRRKKRVLEDENNERTQIKDHKRIK